MSQSAENDAPISAFGWCRLCSLTAEHTHMSDPIIRVIPPASTEGGA